MVGHSCRKTYAFSCQDILVENREMKNVKYENHCGPKITRFAQDANLHDGRHHSFLRESSLWILLVAGITFFALALPALLGQVYVGDDLGEFHLPIRAFYAKQLASGEPFEWMPQLYSGFYVAAEGQLGGYHPLHWILYRAFPLAVAFNLELLASYPFLFFGTWLLLRRLTDSQPAGLYGALVFTFGSFMLLHFFHPNAIAAIAHLPWILLALEIALKTELCWQQAIAEFAIGLLIGSQLLMGYPQCVWFTALTAASFLFWRYSQVGKPLKRIVTIAVPVILGIAIGAIQWMATLHLLDNSVRKTVGDAFVNTGSLHPLNLVQLVAPYLFQTRVVGQNTHELGLYMGAVPMVLFVWLLAHRRLWGRHRQLIWALLAFGALSLFLAFGQYGGLYRLQSFIPIVNRFRFPCRAIVLVQLCMAIGSGIAFTLLVENSGNPRYKMRRSALPWIIVTAIAAAISGPIILPEYVASPILVWFGPLLLLLALALVSRAACGSIIAIFSLVLFTAVDLAAYGLSYSIRHKTAKLADFVRLAPHPPGDTSARVVAPSEKEGLYIGNRMLLAGVTRVDGYAGLQPFRHLDYSQESTWHLAGVQWVYMPDQTTGKRKWIAVSPQAPRARLLGIDNAEVRVLRDSPGRIQIVVNTDTESMLAITENYDPGWRVTIDGREETVSRVESDFLGCGITVGNHDAQFEFRPHCVQSGKRVSLLSLGLLLVLCVLRLLSFPLRRADKTKSGPI